MQTTAQTLKNNYKLPQHFIQNQSDSKLIQSFNSSQSNFISTILSNKKNYGSLSQNFQQQIYEWEATYIQGKFFLADKQTINRYYQIEELMTIQKNRLKELKQKQQILQKQQDGKSKKLNESFPIDNNQFKELIDSGLSQHSRRLFETIKSISEIHKKEDLNESIMSETQKNSYLLNQKTPSQKVFIKDQPNQLVNNKYQRENQLNEETNKLINQHQVSKYDKFNNINQNAYIIGANGRKVYLKTMQKDQQKNISFVGAMTQIDFQKLQKRAKKAKETLQNQEQVYQRKIKQMKIQNKNNNFEKNNFQDKVNEIFVQKKTLSHQKKQPSAININLQDNLSQSQPESQENSFVNLKDNRQRQILSQEQKIMQVNNPQNINTAVISGKLKTITERLNTDKSAQWSSINSNLVKNSQKQLEIQKNYQNFNINQLKLDKKKVILYQTDRQFLTSNQFNGSDFQIHSRKKSNPQLISKSEITVLSQTKRQSGFIRTFKLPIQSIIQKQKLQRLNNKFQNQKSMSLRSKTRSQLSDKISLQSQMSLNKSRSFHIKRKSTQKRNIEFQQQQKKKQISNNLETQKASIDSKKSGYLKKKLQVNIQKIKNYNINKNSLQKQAEIDSSQPKNLQQQQQRSSKLSVKSQLFYKKSFLNKNSANEELNQQERLNFNKSNYLGKILQLNHHNKGIHSIKQTSDVFQSRIHYLEEIVASLIVKLNQKTSLKNEKDGKNEAFNKQVKVEKQDNITSKIKQQQKNNKTLLTIDEVLDLDSLKKSELIDQIKRLKKSIRTLQLQKIKSITINSSRDNMDQNYKQSHHEKRRQKQKQSQIKQLKKLNPKTNVRQKLLQALEKAKSVNQVKKVQPILSFIGPFSQFKDVDEQNFIQKIQLPQLPQPPTYQMGQQQLYQLSIRVYRLFGVQYDETPYTIKDATKRSKLLVKKYKNCVFFDIVGKQKTIVWNLKDKESKFYIGGWQNDSNHLKGTKNGKGLQITVSYIYQGQFYKNKKQGKGKIQYNDGTIYEGQFIQNYKNGLGKQFNASTKQFFIGQFKNNQRDGNGSLKISNKGLYKGLFSKNLKQGYGHQVFQNGDQYKGQYLNNLIHGKGTYFWKNGSSYQGQFQNGKRHGYGKWISAKISDQQQRDIYIGHYKNDRKEGEGKYTWKNGYFYQGQFLNDLKHGQGTLVYENRILQGTWKNGQLINNDFGFAKKEFKDQYTLYQGQYQGIC